MRDFQRQIIHSPLLDIELVTEFIEDIGYTIWLKVLKIIWVKKYHNFFSLIEPMIDINNSSASIAKYLCHSEIRKNFKNKMDIKQKLELRFLMIILV